MRTDTHFLALSDTVLHKYNTKTQLQDSQLHKKLFLFEYLTWLRITECPKIYDSSLHCTHHLNIKLKRVTRPPLHQGSHHKSNSLNILLKLYLTWICMGIDVDFSAWMLLLAGDFAIKAGESDGEGLDGTQRISVVQSKSIICHSAKLHHNVILWNRRIFIYIHAVSTVWDSLNSNVATYGLCYGQSGSFWWMPAWLCRWSSRRATPFLHSTWASYCAARSDSPCFCSDVSRGGRHYPDGMKHISSLSSGKRKRLVLIVLLTLRGRIGTRSPSFVMPGTMMIILLGPFMPKTFVSWNHITMKRHMAWMIWRNASAQISYIDDGC